MDPKMENETEKNEVEVELVLPERLEAIISDVQKDILREDLEEFEKVKENDINIATVYVFEHKDELEAKVYFRNGVNKKINFEYLPLIMINSSGEVVASKVFDLREIGDIPACSATPWKLYFEKSCVDMDKFSPQDCKVIFDSKIKAVNYAKCEYEDFPESLAPFKHEFERFLKDLPNVSIGDISISKFSIGFQENGQLIITLILRNALKKEINLQEIPITVVDENGVTVVSSKFQLENFVVGPMKAKIFNLVIETVLDVEKTADVEKWKILFQ